MREAPAQNEARAAEDIEKVFVSSAQVLPGVSESNEIRIVVQGTLPNPSYKIVRYDVKVAGTTIDITPLAHRDKNMVAIQMLVAFEDTVKVNVRKLGSHVLKINGRSGIVQTEATIAK